jgi:hypothetical protein
LRKSVCSYAGTPTQWLQSPGNLGKIKADPLKLRICEAFQAVDGWGKVWKSAQIGGFDAFQGKGRIADFCDSPRVTG